MRTFAEQLENTLPVQNTHLEHVEDLLFAADQGQAALNILRTVGYALVEPGSVRDFNVSLKWDGAPSVVFGTDPMDGEFFVGTKSVFNKTPKAAKSHAEIDELYPVSVAAILHTCFDRLSSRAPHGIFQGDVLFAPSMLGLLWKNGASFYVFKPNTLQYRVAKDSPLGQRIARSELGIVLHTEYSGPSLNMAISKPIPSSVVVWMAQMPGVFVLDANVDTVSDPVQFSDDEYADFILLWARAEWAVNQLPPAAHIIISQHEAEWRRFINWTVREREPKTAEQLIHFLFKRERDEAAKRKTDAGKQAVIDRYQAVIAVHLDHGPLITAWLDAHTALATVKKYLLDKLNASVPVQAYTIDGAKTPPEGFVVTVGALTVKLVDRDEFSRLNFTQPRAF